MSFIGGRLEQYLTRSLSIKQSELNIQANLKMLIQARFLKNKYQIIVRNVITYTSGANINLK